MYIQHTKKFGFSLTELIIVMAIIGILAGIVYANFGTAGAKGRDAQRQADLKVLQNAIEQYKTKYGRYPAQGCGATGTAFSSEGACNPYIVGHDSGINFSPEFISSLPRDPNRGTAPGYSYLTNTNGTVYKIMISGTVESETVTIDHPLKSCDMTSTTASLSNGWCSVASFSGKCVNNNTAFYKSYAAWGGYEINGSASPNDLSGTALRNAIAPTTNIICR